MDVCPSAMSDERNGVENTRGRSRVELQSNKYDSGTIRAETHTRQRGVRERYMDVMETDET